MRERPVEEVRGPLGGLLDSLTQVVSTLLTMAQTRLELFSAEVQEEVQRGAKVLLWAFIALFAAGTGLLLLALLVVIVFWDSHRVLAAALVTMVFVALAVFAVLRLRALTRDKPRLLDATLNELERDRQQLESRLKLRAGASS